MTKALRSERLKVNIVLGLIVLLFSNLLCLEMRKRLSAGNREPIGQITMKLKDAQRKMSSEVVFESVELSFDIYNLDTLKTSEYSEATVLLKDGTEIKIEENSMVVFSFADDSLSIDFAKGGMQMNSQNNKVKVVSDENKFSIDKGKISFNKKAGKIVELSIEEGKVDLTRKGSSESLDKDSVVQVKEERVLKKEFIARPISPVSAYLPSLEKEKPIEFQWVPADANSKYVLEVKNADTSRIVLSKEVSSNKYSAIIPIGNYRWTLIPKNKTEGVSASSKFAIISNEPVFLTKPSNRSRYTYVKKFPFIIFGWNKEEFFQKYILEISKTSDFQKLEFSRETFNNEILVNSLGAGNYFYRVRAKPILSGMNDKFSETRELEIVIQDKPEPIRLVSPESKKEFFKNKNQGYQSTFVWKKGKEFESYILEISKDENFSSIFKTQKTEEHFFYLKEDVSSGNYFWRVKGIFQGKEIISETRTFFVASGETIKLIQPAGGEELEFGLVEFSWSEISGGSSYTVELSNSRDFTKGVNKYNVEKNFLSIPSPAPGKFFWRVSLKDRNAGKQEIREFRIKPELIPEIVHPLHNSDLDLSPVNSVTLEWRSLPTAISYDLELNDITQGKKIISKKGLPKNKFLIEDLKIFKRGEYELFVQAKYVRRGEEILSKKVRSRFKVILSKTIQKEDVKFLTPDEIILEE